VDAGSKTVTLRKLIAHNVALAMKHRGIGQSGAARKAPGPHQTTVGRLAKAEHDNKLSTLAGAAEQLGFAPWQLLVPGFDPADPPRLVDPGLKPYLKP